MRLFPLMLLTESRPCLVVGEGELAAAKARVAEGAGLHVTQIDDISNIDNIEMVNSGLAFITLSEVSQATEVRDALHRKGYLVNVADQPQLCDFILPAIVDRAPVIVAISTGGASATMARQIRARLESELPLALGDMVRFIGDARSKVATVLTDPESRRQFWDGMTTGGGLCDPFMQEAPPSLEAVMSAAQTAASPVAVRHISIIDLQTCDPADLTLRGLRRLQQADVVLCVGLKSALEPIARLARRDAAIVYDEISTASLDSLAAKGRGVILMPPGATARPLKIADASIEFIYTGKAQL
jgi:uroporphyrin-III C-methyltransferase / precorrin-2 dehydrogenase / sirohydrochlorin ferrochelatase